MKTTNFKTDILTDLKKIFSTKISLGIAICISLLVFLIYACDTLMEESLIASVDNIPGSMQFGWEESEQRISGYNSTFSFVSNADWCSVSNDMIKVETNTAVQSREATVNVLWQNEIMKSITVYQDETAYIDGIPSSLTFSNTSSNQSFNVTGNTSWTATSNMSWCSVSPSSGSGNSTIKVTVSENTTSSTRTANVTIKYGKSSKVIAISQAGIKILNVSTTSISATAASNTYSFNITSNLDWTVTSSQTWCTVSPKSGSGNQTITVTVNTNTLTSTRSAVITVSGSTLTRSVTVTQAAAIVVPTNDLCANAISLSCGASLNGTTVGATAKTITGNTASKYGVWYTFTGDGRQTTLTSTATFDHEIVIYRGSCSSLTFVANKDGSSGGETYTFTPTSGIKYYVYIAHYSTTGTSTQTGTFTISRTCASNLAAPTGVTATQSGSSVIVRWNSVSGATGYEVYYSSTATGTYTYWTSTTNTTITDSSPYNGANYYKVKAKNSSTTSEFSNYAYCYYTAPVATTKITFWTSDYAILGTITVTLTGKGSKTITSNYTSTPSCGASGCANFTDLPSGTYTFSATSSKGYYWNTATITVSTAYPCYLMELSY